MGFSKEKLMLKIFISESTVYKGTSLYEVIVLKAKELKLAGATVTRGIMGFGADSHMHSAKILRLSENLPVVIEVIDEEERINQLLPFLDDIMNEGVVTVETVKVIEYKNK